MSALQADAKSKVFLFCVIFSFFMHVFYYFRCTMARDEKGKQEISSMVWFPLILSQLGKYRLGDVKVIMQFLADSTRSMVPMFFFGCVYFCPQYLFCTILSSPFQYHNLCLVQVTAFNWIKVDYL